MATRMRPAVELASRRTYLYRTRVPHRSHLRIPSRQLAPKRSCSRLNVLGFEDVLDDGTASSIMPLLSVVVPSAAVLGVALWRFIMYSQIEYITASMLSRWIPKDAPGSRVVQLGGSVKEMYYYPKNIVSLLMLGEKLNKSLLEQAGLQAAVPVVARKLRPTTLSFEMPGTVDSVVAIRTLADFSTSELDVFLKDANRVLKPGRPLVFIERVEDEGAPLRFLAGGAGILSQEALDQISSCSGFKDVQWDVALSGQDPYVVGVAVRGQTMLDGPRIKEIKPVVPKIRRKITSSSKGFE